MALSIFNIDPGNPNTISSFVTDAWAVRHLYKYALERQWFLNIAWFKGNQNVIWDDVSRLLREPAAPPWRVRLVINLINGSIRTIVSKLIRPRYEPDVIPPTEDALDIETAALDKQVIQSYWKMEQVNAKILDAVEWMCQTGNVFIHVKWNPNKGDPLNISSADLLDDYYETNDPQRAGRLASAASRLAKFSNIEDIGTGDLEIEVVPPFEMMLDPFAIRGIEDSNWCLRSRVYDVNSVKEDWEDAAENIVANPGYYSTSAILNYRERIQRLTSVKGFITGGAELSEPTALVHELWVKPRGRGKLKHGLYAVVCQNHVLNGDGNGVEFPYAHGELPFIHLKEIPIKGSAWATCTLEQMLHIQSDYNRTKSQIVESKNLMGSPKWLAPSGSITDSYIDSEPGQVITYNHGFKPEMVSPPPLPSYINDLLIGYKQDLEDITGQHEVSRAESPGEVRSGRGILALIEQDETRLGPTLERIDNGVIGVCKLMMCTLTQFVKEPRISKIIGEDDELIMTEWTGKDLIGKDRGRPSNAYFDIRLATISGMPNSRSAQIGLIDSLANRGFLDPKADKKLVFRMIGIGQVQGILDNGRIHRTRAILENKQMSNGTQVKVEPYQDHDAHLEIHNNFRNSAAYDSLGDNIKQLFVIHEQQHKLMAAMLRVEPAILERQAIQQLVQAHGLVTQGQGDQKQSATEPSQQPQEIGAE